MKHLAWDFDGTIVNVFQVWNSALTQVCQEKNLALPTDNEKKLSFGNTQWQGFSCWDLPLKIQEDYRFLAYQQVAFIQKMNPEALLPIAEVITAIKKFSKLGYTQSLVTSRPRPMLLDMLEHLDLKADFQLYNALECAQEQQLQDKPAPDKLVFVMKQLAVAPENTVVIGDTSMDIGMAVSAKAKSIGVTWGMGTEEQLREAGASRVLSAPALLEEAIYSLTVVPSLA